MVQTSAEVMCPYCGEVTVCQIEPSVEEWILDCEVCCRPMEARRVDTGGDHWVIETDLA